jgi:hypothetical protein
MRAVLTIFAFYFLFFCAKTASRADGHIIGAVSGASSSTKAMLNASTAQDIFVIAPVAAHLEYRVHRYPFLRGERIFTSFFLL